MWRLGEVNMPSQGHLVCGVRCKNEQEVRELYLKLGVDMQKVDVSNPIELYEATADKIDMIPTQISILERITGKSRQDLEKLIGLGNDDAEISPMEFEPIGDIEEIGHSYPQEYVFGVRLTGRYCPEVLDFDPEKRNPSTGWLLGAGGAPCKIDYNSLGIVLEIIRKKIPEAEIYITDLFH